MLEKFQEEFHIEVERRKVREEAIVAQLQNQSTTAPSIGRAEPSRVSEAGGGAAAAVQAELAVVRKQLEPGGVLSSRVESQATTGA